MAYPQSSGGTVAQKASKTGIIWAIAIFVVTAIIGIVMIVLGATSLVNAINDFKEIRVPGETTVQLGKGEQWIFVGRPSDTRIDISDVTVTILDPDGSVVPIKDDTSQSANNSGDDFESVGRFDADVAGEYTVETTGPAEADIRIGKIPFLKIGVLIGGGIAIGFIGFVVALIILIVALVRRSRVKKANRAAAMGYGAPGGPPAGYGAGPYGAPPGPQPYGQAEPPYPQQGPPPPMPPPATPTPPPPAAPTPPPPAPTPPPPAAPTPPPTEESPSWPPPSGPTPPPPAPPG